MIRHRAAWLMLAAGLGLTLAAQDVQSGNPKQRIRAAREFGKQGSDAIAKLRPLLADQVVEVRVEAVKAVVEIGTQHSLDPLIQATRDNEPEIQIRATDGLVNFYLPGYVRTGLGATLSRARNALKARWTDVNDQVIGPYIQARPDVIEALGKLARGGANMDARANAARAIGILRGAAAIPDLAEALHSKDDQVLYESLTALQKIGDPAAAPKMIFLLHDLNDKVQLAALETAGQLRNREALPGLREALDRARNNKIRRAALIAIAKIPDPGSRDLFSRYFADKDDGLRAAAAEGFARLKNPADAALIEAAFQEEKKMSPRLSQAFALVMLGKTGIAELSPLQYLVNTLNSSAWKGVARPFLIEAGREIGVRKPLESAARKGTKDEKIQLSQILAANGDKDTVSCLDELSRDRDTDVAQEALNALRALKARL